MSAGSPALLSKDRPLNVKREERAFTLGVTWKGCPANGYPVKVSRHYLSSARAAFRGQVLKIYYLSKENASQ